MFVDAAVATTWAVDAAADGARGIDHIAAEVAAVVRTTAAAVAASDLKMAVHQPRAVADNS